MKNNVGSCNGGKFDKHRKFITIKRNLDHSSRELSLYDKEAEVREISDAFSQSSSSPWHTESVTRFVKRSVQDFQTLLKWLEELEGKEKWDEAAICDVTYGLDTIHKNLVNNLTQNYGQQSGKQMAKELETFTGVNSHFLFFFGVLRFHFSFQFFH